MKIVVTIDYLGAKYVAKIRSKITWVITIVGLGQEEYPLFDQLVCNGGFGKICAMKLMI